MLSYQRRKFIIVLKLKDKYCLNSLVSTITVMLCTIWYHLHNLKNVKNTHGGVLILVKLQALAFWIVQMVQNRVWRLKKSTDKVQTTATNTLKIQIQTSIKILHSSRLLWHLWMRRLRRLRRWWATLSLRLWSLLIREYI